jgi:hypothetical protein
MSTNASRRGLLGAIAALPLAAVPVAALAAAGATNPDAELISLSNRLVEAATERHNLNELDPWAPDKGPYHERYEASEDDFYAIGDRLCDLAGPTTTAGMRALARAALVHVERTYAGEICTGDVADAMVWTLAEAIVPDFAWPPPSPRGDARQILRDDARRALQVEFVSTVEQVADPKELADAAMVMLSCAWKVAQEKAADAGRVITLDDLRSIGLPIPADLVLGAAA